MARPLRYFESWQPVEVTARTVQGRFLLKPSRRLNALIAGILAIAQERYEVHLFNFVFLSNHFHILASAASPRVLSDFMRFVMSNVAREAGRLHDWSGPLWERRYRVIPIVDDASLIDRMRYLFENGCKEGMVAHPALWEGLQAVDALCSGADTDGIWVDRTAFFLARRGKGGSSAGLTEEAFTSHHTLRLDPLPCWMDFTEEERQAKCRELVEEAVKAAPPSVHGARARKPVRSRSPHHRPSKIARRNAPSCHASCRENRANFREAYRTFVNAYRVAAERLRVYLPSLGYPTHAQVLAFAACSG